MKTSLSQTIYYIDITVGAVFIDILFDAFSQAINIVVARDGVDVDVDVEVVVAGGC